VSRAAPARVRTFTLAERPDLERAVRRLVGSIWPREMEYIHHDAVCGRHWGALRHAGNVTTCSTCAWGRTRRPFG
jgi:hypothetical protein